MMIKFFYLIILAFGTSAFALEEPDSLELIRNYELRPKFGVYGHYNLNLHQTSFSSLDGAPICCPEFNFGFGSGFSAGGFIEIPSERYFSWENANKFEFGARLGYASYDGEFNEYDNTTVIVDGVSEEGEFKYNLLANYHTIGIEPFVTYLYTKDIRFMGGFRAGYSTYDHFYQVERITKPSNRGVFPETGLQKRNERAGDIENVSKFQFALNLGVGYELPLNERGSLFAQPELFYTFNLTPVQTGKSWFIHNFHGGVSVKYKKPLPPPPPPPAPLAPPDPGVPMPEAPPVAIVNIDAVEIDSNNNLNKNFNIKIEDFVSLNMRPLLNYVFFEHNSAEIPGRYNLIDELKTDDFSLDMLQGLDAIETYYHVLNIIGKRMKNNPDADVTLVGTNSNAREEKGNLELSKNRAERVKKYLTDVWSVDPSRISVRARNLPKQPTRQDEPEGEEENRRVEIIPDDWKITEPVVTIDTMRVLTKSTIRFDPEVQSPKGVKGWKLSVEQQDKALFSKSGDETIPENFEWKINNKKENVPSHGGNIEYRFVIEDSLGQTFSSDKKYIPVEQLTVDRKRLERIKDKEFEYYSLILFDFGSSNLEYEHRQVVDLVKDRVTQDATVYVNGYTDKLGDEEINERISERRARSVARRLNIPGAKVEGLGESELLYDNDLPEGRYYCRTVQIIIETPVKEK